MVLMLTFVMLRIISIAVRYGYMAPQKMKTIRKQICTYEYLSSDMLIAQLTKPSPNSIEEEIRQLLWNLRIEEKQFKIAFISPVGEEFHDRLHNHE